MQFHRRASQIFLLVFFLNGCSHSSVTPSLSTEELKQYDQSVNLELAQELEGHFEFKNDALVSRYLHQVAKRVGSAAALSQDSPIKVSLIRSPEAKWKSYSLPGSRLYLSVEVLRALEFENEVAAELAIQLAHIQNSYVLNRLKIQARGGDPFAIVPELEEPSPEPLTQLDVERALQSLKFLGPKGILTFTYDETMGSLQSAVDILYRAGYDPRGLITLLDKYKHFQSHSPYDKRTLDKLKGIVRRKIALQAPLLNPTVRTQEFLLIQKRIGSL